MNKFINPFIVNLPQLDLHGESKEIALFYLNNFINENLLTQQYKIIIIHGIGQKILTKAVREYLKFDHRVKNYELDLINDGITIVNLKE